MMLSYFYFSRSECLGFLISNAEYISDSNCTIQWTGEFIYTIKLLLEKGVDPTWIPNADSPEVKISDTYSAQYNFFGVIKKMIVKKNHIFHASWISCHYISTNATNQSKSEVQYSMPLLSLTGHCLMISKKSHLFSSILQ